MKSKKNVKLPMVEKAFRPISAGKLDAGVLEGRSHGSTESRPTSGGSGRGELRVVKHGLCRPSPTQPRQVFGRIEEMAESIRTNGVQEPLLVRPRPPYYTLLEPDLLTDKSDKPWIVTNAAGDVQDAFKSEEAARAWAAKESVVAMHNGNPLEAWFEIVDGERRWRASGVAGLTEVPVCVREMSDEEVVDYQFISFGQKEGLNELEEGAAFRKAIETERHTVESLVKTTGKSRSHIFGRMALAKVSGPVRESLEKGEIPATVAQLLAGVPGEKNQKVALTMVLSRGEYDQSSGQYGVMSFRRAQTFIRENYSCDLTSAPFDRKDETLVEGAGQCELCPKRSGNCRELFPDIQGPNVCTDLDCFNRKKAANLARVAEKVVQDGGVVLPAKEAEKLFRYGGNEPEFYSTPYTELSDRVEGDKKHRTYQQLLGKDAPDPVVAISPKGKPVKVYRESELRAKLKEKGFDFADQAKQTAQTKAEREAKEQKTEQREKFAKEKLMPMLLARVEKSTNSLENMASFLRLLIEVELAECNHGGMHDAVKRQGKKPAGMFLDELKVALLESRLNDDMNDYSVVGYDGEWSEGAKVACKWADIDLAAEEKVFLNPELPGAKFEAAAAKGKAKAKPGKATTKTKAKGKKK